MIQRRWLVAARIALVLLAMWHSPTKHGFGGVSAFRSHKHPRGKLIHSHFRCPDTNVNPRHRFAPIRDPFVVGMFPPLPPSFEYDDEVVFVQRATNTRIVGKDKLERSIVQWEEDFRTEVDDDYDANYEYEDSSHRLRSARLQTTVATTVSPTTLLVRWNATYVDPSVAWLLSLSESIPGWIPDFKSYTDQASQVRKFSYSALAKLFGNAIVTGKLRVPLACIEGTSTCEFREDNTVVSIAEDLAYAQDLNRGALSNRLCARDLQFFLEVARKPLHYPREDDERRKETNDKDTAKKQQYEYWEDLVAEALPWRSVPGMMDPMYIEGQSEDDLTANVPLVFGVISVALVLLFANWVAPSLIGQSLLGPPSYIVPPSELNEILPY